MATEHIVTDADTLQSLAYTYLGDSTRWTEIADYNGLEYPYLVRSEEERSALHASGYLTVARELYSSALTIYKGSIFASKTSTEGIQRLYEVVEDTRIPAGVATGHALVRCTVYGTFGNTIAYSINQLYKVSTSLGPSLSSLTVYNEFSIENGTDSTVKVTGEPVYIPVEGDESIQVITSVNSYLDLLGGEDLAMAPDGDLTEDSMGDLGSVAGLANIKQAVYVRLSTERGALPHHPEYGTRLNELIGKANAPYVMKLMELDIHECMAYEDRIDSVQVLSLRVEGTAIFTTLVLQISKETLTYALKLNF